MSDEQKEKIPKELGSLIEVEEEDDDEITKFAKNNDVILMAFIASYVPRRYSPTTRGFSTINIVDEFSIEQAITEICAKTKHFPTKKLYLLVNSPGGALHSAFKTAIAVRNAFDDITVFVPHIAASGGTLIAMTGNRIVMGMMSQLSPLDVQILSDNGNTVSVNSYFKAKERLDNYFSKKSVKDSPYSMQHMAESLDPVIFEEFTGIQEEGIAYTGTILDKAGYTKSEKAKIINSLVFTLPTHGFVIQYSTAKEIGLHVAEENTFPKEWVIMRKWLSKYLMTESDKHFIRYCLPSNNNNQTNSINKKASKKKQPKIRKR